MKINYQYGMVVQFPEKRGVLGELDSNKAWTAQKCEQSAWSQLLLSLLHLTLEVIGKKKAGCSFLTQIHKTILLIQILLCHKSANSALSL